ncbi:FmdB family zinc ribbon protein [Nocardiopsis listeri]|uniref:FmdB family zinc ribbon protein n=1 Tax=Nocardiopsis listeri TaxID=53440 RepID=UPI0008376DD4|nr:FmdB family zinc ribbon protein [Nocardiopsis listeri]
MPTYQYACTECDAQMEVVQSFSDDSLTVCPECEGRLRKVYSAVGIVFKGSGFYRTDSSSSTSNSSTMTGSGSAEGKDSKPSGSGDSAKSGDSTAKSASSGGDSSSGGKSTGSPTTASTSKS